VLVTVGFIGLAIGSCLAIPLTHNVLSLCTIPVGFCARTLILSRSENFQTDPKRGRGSSLFAMKLGNSVQMTGGFRMDAGMLSFNEFLKRGKIDLDEDSGARRSRFRNHPSQHSETRLVMIPG
jgi:hypothetical protein